MLPIAPAVLGLGVHQVVAVGAGAGYCCRMPRPQQGQESSGRPDLITLDACALAFTVYRPGYDAGGDAWYPGRSLTDLPEYDRPPVVEMAIGVQFRPLDRLRGLALGPLRELWQAEYPRIEEQSALAPVMEGSPPLAQQRLQLGFMSLPPVRQWFLSTSGAELVQVQPDRLLVNWRADDEIPTKYPRYPHMRGVFERRFTDLAQFTISEGLGELEVSQAELTYINVIEATTDDLGRVDRFLKGWSGTPKHHLGEPEQSRLTLTFLVPGIGRPPVRLYVEINPAHKLNGEPVLFLTLTVRGDPGGWSLSEVLTFLDAAHDHLVRSFDELTEESMREAWGRRR